MLQIGNHQVLDALDRLIKMRAYSKAVQIATLNLSQLLEEEAQWYEGELSKWRSAGGAEAGLPKPVEPRKALPAALEAGGVYSKEAIARAGVVAYTHLGKTDLRDRMLKELPPAEQKRALEEAGDLNALIALLQTAGRIREAVPMMLKRGRLEDIALAADALVFNNLEPSALNAEIKSSGGVSVLDRPALRPGDDGQLAMIRVRLATYILQVGFCM
jgi:hypothetical protein